jgi:4-hydroxy-3-polyprenylbenzoate decarboxylase
MAKVVVAISGSSAVKLGLELLEHVSLDHEVHLIVSKGAKKVLKHEHKMNLQNLPKTITIHKNSDLSAPISSGSFGIDKLIVAPCSMSTLAKCALGISDNLIARAFHVALKENKRVVLAPREMPYSAINLEHMYKLASLGVSIAPPVIGYYGDIHSLDGMEKFIVGKWLDLLDIDNTLYKRWGKK